MPTALEKRLCFAALLLAVAAAVAVLTHVASPDEPPVPAANSSSAADRAPETSRGPRPRPTPIPAAALPEVEVEDPDDPDAPDGWADPAVKPLTVSVVDRDGRPIGGAPVVLLGKDLAAGALAPPRLTRRDGAAHFPIDLALEREGDLIVAARVMPAAAVFAPVSVVLGRASEVRLVVDAGARIRVRVVDPEGLPLAGVARVRKLVVEEVPAETGERGPQLTAAFGETTPRAIRDGVEYVLPGVRPGERFTLLAEAAGFAPALQEVELPAPAPSDFAVEARLGPRTGAVVFRAAPPPGFDGWAFGARFVDDLEAVAAAGADDRPTQTSPRFRRETPAGRPRRLRVDAYATGAAVASAEVDVPALRPGETLELGEVRLEPVRTALAGIVVDLDDRPVAGAVVEALPLGATAPLASTTDAAGRFSLRGLPGRGPYHVAAHAPGRASGRLETVVEGAVELRLVLEPAGAVEGRVLGPRGVAREALRVRALRADRAPTATAPAADGTFRLEGLPVGVYVLVVDGPGIEPLRVGDVVVTPPETTKDDRLLRLDPRAAPRGEV